MPTFQRAGLPTEEFVTCTGKIRSRVSSQVFTHLSSTSAPIGAMSALEADGADKVTPAARPARPIKLRRSRPPSPSRPDMTRPSMPCTTLLDALDAPQDSERRDEVAPRAIPYELNPSATASRQAETTKLLPTRPGIPWLDLGVWLYRGHNPWSEFNTAV